MWEMVLSRLHVEPLLHVQDMQLQHTYLRGNKGFKHGREQGLSYRRRGQATAVTHA